MRIIDDKSRNFCNNNLLISLILNTIHPIGNGIFTLKNNDNEILLF